ncbi:MAG: hypothetical protein HKN49_02215 [Gammaproteobacteria bacterium]|nr:hypothetical protein [Gammaproteobacteria bacterium]
MDRLARFLDDVDDVSGLLFSAASPALLVVLASALLGTVMVLWLGRPSALVPLLVLTGLAVALTTAGQHNNT